MEIKLDHRPPSWVSLKAFSRLRTPSRNLGGQAKKIEVSTRSGMRFLRERVSETRVNMLDGVRREFDRLAADFLIGPTPGVFFNCQETFVARHHFYVPHWDNPNPDPPRFHSRGGRVADSWGQPQGDEGKDEEGGIQGRVIGSTLSLAKNVLFFLWPSTW